MYNKVIYLSKWGHFRVTGDTVNNYAETSINGDCPRQAIIREQCLGLFKNYQVNILCHLFD